MFETIIFLHGAKIKFEILLILISEKEIMIPVSFNVISIINNSFEYNENINGKINPEKL